MTYMNWHPLEPSPKSTDVYTHLSPENRMQWGSANNAEYTRKRFICKRPGGSTSIVTNEPERENETPETRTGKHDSALLWLGVTQDYFSGLKSSSNTLLIVVVSVSGVVILALTSIIIYKFFISKR